MWHLKERSWASRNVVEENMSREESPTVSHRTLNVLEWFEVQHQLSERARTPMGKVFCDAYVPSLLNHKDARIQAEAILELVSLKRENNLALPLGEIPDTAPLLKRISREGAISVEEFAQLIRAHKATQGLAHFLERYTQKYESVSTLLSGLDLVVDWSSKHFHLLDAQGLIVDSASEDLAALRALVRELHKKIQVKLEDYLHNPKISEVMQDFYVTVRDGRYVLPIKTNFRGRVGGIVHDVSNTESTLFVEPEEIVEWNNQLKVAEKEIEKEIERILLEVVRATKPFVGRLEKNHEIVTRADFFGAAALFVEAWKGPATATEWASTLEFTKLFHPILSLQRSVVSNSLLWSEAMILTGPNAGGKTVLLKSIGMAVCMALAGLPVPALHAKLPEDLNQIFADIGDDQNLEQNLSTFSGHMSVLKEMLEQAKKGALILLDEIATGTSPEEGQPLAQAIVEEFLQKSCRIFVTTHYGALKTFAMTDARCRVASMAVGAKDRRPTYEILLDIPGESSAFEMALQMGFPSSVVERARTLKGEAPRDMQAALKRFEEARASLLERERELIEQKQKGAEREEAAQKKILEYTKLQREGLSTEARDILKTLTSLRDELSQQVKATPQVDLAVGAREQFQKISEASEKVRGVVQMANESSGLFAEELPLESIVPQANVEVEGFGMGSILEVPKDLKDNPRAQVRVQVGDMQMSVGRSRLRKADSEKLQRYKTARAANVAAKERKITQTLVGSPRGTSSGSIICDVRGKTLDEAMRRVETSLNDLVRDDQAVITIIHGHGSDKLKDGIRTYLSSKRDDLVYRAGAWPGEGGDGVTVVEKRS